MLSSFISAFFLLSSQPHDPSYLIRKTECDESNICCGDTEKDGAGMLHTWFACFV